MNLRLDPPDGLGVTGTTPSGFYAISIDDYSDSGTTYTAVAVGIGRPTEDKAACRTLTINQNGRALARMTVAGCWK